jgi:hypothetical protein
MAELLPWPNFVPAIPDIPGFPLFEFHRLAVRDEHAALPRPDLTCCDAQAMTEMGQNIVPSDWSTRQEYPSYRTCRPGVLSR